MKKWKKWRVWQRLRDWCNGRMKAAWMEGGNCDSCCPRCKQRESSGNSINTTSMRGGEELRVCMNCSYAWVAIFTPAGFIMVREPRGSEA